MDMRIDSVTAERKERYLCDAYFDECVEFVMNAWDFLFMMKSVKLTEKVTGSYPPKPYFTTCWKLPQDFGKAYQINCSMKNAYSVRKEGIWTLEDEPVLEYMSKSLETDEDGSYTAPVMYLSLIAYQLALHIAPKLAPESSAQSIAAQLYQLNLRALKDTELRNNDNSEKFESSPNPYLYDISRI